MGKELKRKISVYWLIAALLFVAALSVSFVSAAAGESGRGDGREKAAASGFASCGSVSAPVSGVFSDAGPAVTVYGGYQKSSWRVMVQLQSHLEAVRKYYEKAGMEVLNISVVGGKVGLRCDRNQAKSVINGSEGTEEDFEELLGAAVTFKERMDSQSKGFVDFSVQPWGTEGFDNEYFPLILQLDKWGPEQGEHSDTYEFFGSLRYRVTVRTQEKGITSFVSETEEAAKQVEIVI